MPTAATRAGGERGQREEAEAAEEEQRHRQAEGTEIQRATRLEARLAVGRVRPVAVVELAVVVSVRTYE